MFRTSFRVLLALTSVAFATACSGADESAGGDDSDLTQKAKVAPSDVSVLFPLPDAANVESLLSPKSSGARGELLPEAIVKQMPSLVVPLGANDKIFPMLRVVSMRVDPCFAALTDQGAKCRNQLRLILQPLRASEDKLSGEDAGIHAFYSLSRAELTSYLKEYLALRRTSTVRDSGTLGAHPVLSQLGMTSEFATSFKSLILKYAGSANLTKVTFRTREAPRQGAWRFGGFEVVGGNLRAEPIPNLDSTTVQSISQGGFADFRMTANPLPAGDEDNIAPLFETLRVLASTKENAAPLYDAALRIENPTRHTPETMDCASCHSTHARLSIESKFQLSAAGNTNAFPAAVTAGNALVRSPQTFQAFSYAGTFAAISQRTLNETTAVVQFINTRVLTGK